MSMLDVLRRFIDPIAHRQVQAERKRKAEAPTPQREAGKLTCRVCGYEGEHAYCPRCLAMTMQPRRRR
jgi:rubrerythrin